MPALGRAYYSNNFANVATNTTTVYQDYVTLSFTPEANKNYAVFYCCQVTQTNTADFVETLLYNSTDVTTMFYTRHKPQDAVNDWLFSGGLSIYQANATPAETTVNIQFRQQGGSTASIRDGYLTVLELSNSDIFYSNNSTATIANRQYQTVGNISLPAGDYILIASASMYQSGGIGTYDEVSATLYNNTDAEPYGFQSQRRSRDNSESESYWYVMSYSPTSTKDMQLKFGEGDTSIVEISYRNILAIDRTAFAEIFSSHAENEQSTTSTSDQTAETVTVNLNQDGDILCLASWHARGNDNDFLNYSSFNLNSTNVYTGDFVIKPPTGNASLNASSQWWCGFCGVLNLSSGSNTIDVKYRSSSASRTSYIARVNVTGVSLVNPGFLYYSKSSGSWKYSSDVYFKQSSNWKQASNLYIKNSGTWKSLFNKNSFTGENVDAFSNDYDASFPAVPPPPPTCVGFNTLITMWDGTKKYIQDVVIGDIVKTLSGVPGTVLGVKPVPLSPARRMVRMYHPDGSYLRVSDDHDLWISEKGVEQWGTYNYNWWIHEAEYYGELHVPALALVPIRPYKFATSYGWLKTECQWEHDHDPNEIIWGVKIDQGGGYIADGFVVISEGCTNEDIANVKWNGIG